MNLLPRFTPAQRVAALFGLSLVNEADRDELRLSWLGAYQETWLVISVPALFQSGVDPLIALGRLIRAALEERYGPGVFSVQEVKTYAH